MPGQELDTFSYHDRMMHVVDEYLLKGITNATKISKDSGIPRAQVVTLIEDWKKIATNDEWLKSRAKESLQEFDRTYDQLTEKWWEVFEATESPREQNAILKNLADAAKARQEVLQKAGLYDDAALGDELALREEQIEQIRGLLKTVAQKYPDARIFIMEELGRIFKTPERVEA